MIKNLNLGLYMFLTFFAEMETGSAPWTVRMVLTFEETQGAGHRDQQAYIFLRPNCHNLSIDQETETISNTF